ncbi:MAG: RAMP superfamily CRISPR-associated protein [Cyanobacteria bacterium J06634_6]
MTHYKIAIELLSDTTFGRGDGVAGLIDQEVEHDASGLPYLRGRALKGLLAEECENLIAQFPAEQKAHWQGVADQLFGTLGSTLETIAVAHFGDACLPTELREIITYQIKQETITAPEVLNSLTTIRRQTAIDAITGAPDKGSLRSARVVVRQQTFIADIQFESAPTDEMRSLLALGIVALRRLGSCRNRGRGHVKCRLQNNSGKDITDKYLNAFQPQEVSA